MSAFKTSECKSEQIHAMLIHNLVQPEKIFKINTFVSVPVTNNDGNLLS